MQQATLPDSIVAAMQAAIDQEFEKSARLRKIIPEVHMPGARYGVVVPDLDLEDNESFLSATTKGAREPVRLTVELQFDTTQIQDEALALDLATTAARRLARAEDETLAYGGSYEISPPVKREEGDIEGLFADAVDNQRFPKTRLDLSLPANTKLTTAIARAVAALDTHQTGPYAAALATEAWTEYVELESKKRREVLGTLADGSVVPIGATADYGDEDTYAVVLSTDPGSVDLVRVQKPTLTRRGFTPTGNPRCILEGQFLLRVKQSNAAALVTRAR